MSQNSLHVVPDPKGGWSVRRSGAARASKRFPTREEAIEHGRALAKKARGDVYVHGRDGSIRDRATYRDEPKAAKG